MGIQQSLLASSQAGVVALPASISLAGDYAGGPALTSIALQASGEAFCMESQTGTDPARLAPLSWSTPIGGNPGAGYYARLAPIDLGSATPTGGGVGYTVVSLAVNRYWEWTQFSVGSISGTYLLQIARDVGMTDVVASMVVYMSTIRTA